MSLVEILIFRHGQTDWNKENRIQGHTDTPLNDTGIQQALGLQPILERFAPEAILSSDLLRAVKTAELALGQKKIPIHQTPNLREAYLGRAEGMLRSEFIKQHGLETLNRWASTLPEDENATLPGSESKKDHRERLLNYLFHFLQSNPQYKKIAVSTHHTSIIRIIHACSNSPAQIAVCNAGIFQLTANVTSRSLMYIS